MLPWVFSALLLAGCAAPRPQTIRPDPDRLWWIVEHHCLAGPQPTSPCIATWPDPARRAALLKDRRGAAQYLLVPIDRIPGIESERLLQPASPNYFAAAWQARGYVAQALGVSLPREYASLALNSAYGRSQNQLHIHVDCLRTDIRAQLDRIQGGIGERWQDLPVPLSGHRYRARFVAGAGLTEDPVRLLAQDLPRGDSMAPYTLVVVAAHDARGAPGFVLLSSRHDDGSGNRASGEELQDHDCKWVQSIPMPQPLG